MVKILNKYKIQKIVHNFLRRFRKVCAIFMDEEDKDFITSYFEWISLSKQKEKAEELQNMTKNKEKER